MSLTWVQHETRDGSILYTAKLLTLYLQVKTVEHGFSLTLEHPHGTILGSLHPGPLKDAQEEIAKLSGKWLGEELRTLVLNRASR